MSNGPVNSQIDSSSREKKPRFDPAATIFGPETRNIFPVSGEDWARGAWDQRPTQPNSCHPRIRRGRCRALKRRPRRASRPGGKLCTMLRVELRMKVEGTALIYGRVSASGAVYDERIGRLEIHSAIRGHDGRMGEFRRVAQSPKAASLQSSELIPCWARRVAEEPAEKSTAERHVEDEWAPPARMHAPLFFTW